MKPSQNALTMIKNREQCRLTSYKLQGEKYYTIGWGHYLDTSNPINAQYNRAGAKITQAQADAFLALDVENKTKILKSKIKVSVNQNLWDALVSVTYQYNPNNATLNAIFRAVNLGYSVINIAQMLMAMPSNSYNKKARKVDATLITTGKVVHINRV